MKVEIPKKADEQGLKQLRDVIAEIERIWREEVFEDSPFTFREEDSAKVAVSVILFKQIKICRAELYFQRDSGVIFYSFRNNAPVKVDLPSWNEGVAKIVECLNFYARIKISGYHRCKIAFTDLIGETPTKQHLAISPETAEQILNTKIDPYKK